MKTLLKKLNVLAKATSFTLILTLLTSAAIASGNQTSAADSGATKFSKSKSVASQPLTLSTSLSSYEKELNAITNQISEAVKFRATPLEVEVNFKEVESDLKDITDEVAKNVKFQPAVIL